MWDKTYIIFHSFFELLIGNPFGFGDLLFLQFKRPHILDPYEIHIIEFVVDICAAVQKNPRTIDRRKIFKIFFTKNEAQLFFGFP